MGILPVGEPALAPNDSAATTAESTAAGCHRLSRIAALCAELDAVFLRYADGQTDPDADPITLSVSIWPGFGDEHRTQGGRLLDHSAHEA